jgi:ABC-type transport system involved in cytochrome c biogenesis permease subunit
MQWLAFAPFPFYLFGIVKRPFLFVGLLLQSAYIITRGLQLDRLPLVGPHDTLCFLSASIALFSIPFSRSMKRSPQFLPAVAFTAALFTTLSLISKQNNAPLPPVLRIVWFELHVVLAFLSYALFALAAILGILYLRRSDARAEDLQYKAVLVAYTLFSLSMVFGGIWAYLAWGTYWLWTPKELWTSILWLFYTFYLHAHLRRWWMGRPSAVLGIAGFGVVLFTYLGVSLLMKSSHSF